jgi:starvation-inducible DNA-binding protein
MSQSPQPLATHTYLSADEVKQVADAVNPLIADAFALYVKTKNFHWHVSGPRFRDLHLLFDEHAAQILESIDPMAERLRKIGATTLRSIQDIGQHQAIKDNDDEFVDPQDMVRLLMEDNQAMAKNIHQAAQTCDEARDLATANVLEEILDATEKRHWFLFEILQEEK